jgi:chloramphenicol-sensitive protein RarD
MVAPSQAGRGAAAAVAAYGLWGFLPVFWKQLGHVDAHELIAHRIVWSLGFLLGLLALQGGLATLRAGLGSLAGAGRLGLAGLLLTANWWVFVWGVQNGRLIECSLGYFLVPLANAGFGRLVFGERLRRAQGIALALAAGAVGLQLWNLGHLPWIGVTIAVTWSLYSLLKKGSPVGAIPGLAAETLLMLPFAAGYLIWEATHGRGALGHSDAPTTLLVCLTGVVTAIPLLLFGAGARRLRLTTLGLLQYIAPSLHFLLGWGWYHEALDPVAAVAFGCIWAALALYTADAWASRRRNVAG